MAEGYLDNKRFHESLKDWIKNRPDQPMPEYCGYCIMKIAQGFSRRHNWSRYTPAWKENMVGLAIEYMVRYAKNYKYDQFHNPHAYFSFITENTFKTAIKKEKKEYAAKVSATLEVLEGINNSDDSEFVIPDDVHFDLLQKMDAYGGAMRPYADRKQRITKNQKAAASAESMDEWL